MIPVVGLTGGIGSGKSTAEHLFNQLGVESVDADRESHAVVSAGEPALAKVVEHFEPLLTGNQSLLTDQGELNRPLLRQLVFSNAAEKQWLEQLLHPLIRQRIEAQLATAQGDYVLLVSPLLFETGQEAMTDAVVVVDVTQETQLQRAGSRDNCSPEQVQRIINAQIERSKRLELADYVLENECSESELRQQVEVVHQQLVKRLSGADQ